MQEWMHAAKLHAPSAVQDGSKGQSGQAVRTRCAAHQWRFSVIIAKLWAGFCFLAGASSVWLPFACLWRSFKRCCFAVLRRNCTFAADRLCGRCTVNGADATTKLRTKHWERSWSGLAAWSTVLRVDERKKHSTARKTLA